MNFYAVIDTNVVVSAMLKRDSVPAFSAKRICCYTSRHAQYCIELY